MRERAISSNTATSSNNENKRIRERSFQDLFENGSPKFAGVVESKVG
jgi:hypothetical protein